MKQLSEEQLNPIHYDEADEKNDRRTMDEHLASCGLCHSRYLDLQHALALFGEAPVPERPETYGHEVWMRLRPRLMEEPGSAWADFFSPRRWALAGALAALLALAFFAGRYSPRLETQTAPSISRTDFTGGRR